MEVTFSYCIPNTPAKMNGLRMLLPLICIYLHFEPEQDLSETLKEILTTQLTDRGWYDSAPKECFLNR